MKDFLDNPETTASNIAALKVAISALKANEDEFAKHFLSLANQDLMIANIRALMGLRNIKVEDLSKNAGKNRSYVGRLLRKDFNPFHPSVETVRGIALALNVRPSTLLFVDLRVEFQKSIESIEQYKEEDSNV